MTMETMITQNNEKDDDFVICSAPGKVLVTGGYLVLERPNSGMVLATDACFHTTVGKITVNNEKDVPQMMMMMDHGTKNSYYLALNVYSPQFFTTYYYWIHVSTNSEDDQFPEIQLLPRKNNYSRNSFLEKVLSLIFAFVFSHSKDCKLWKWIKRNDDDSNMDIGLGIQWMGDDDFYSSITKNKEDGSIEVHKTGLGSSAALVTSTVGALLDYSKIISSTVSQDIDRIVHNVAQAVHGWAQGKIGSGFDVSAAIYGSHIYTRFDPSIMDSLFDIPYEESTISSEMSRILYELCYDETKWNSIVQQIHNFPFQLALIDVCGGSESPSMAKRVLAWKKKKKNGDMTVWNELQRLNQEIHDWFLHPMTNTTTTTTTTSVKELQTKMLKGRSYMKQMGMEANVPIEPDEQTELANLIMETIPENIIMTGVPGAGGYDALYILYNNKNNNDGNEQSSKKELDQHISQLNSTSTSTTTYRTLTCRHSDHGYQFQHICTFEWP